MVCLSLFINFLAFRLFYLLGKLCSILLFITFVHFGQLDLAPHKFVWLGAVFHHINLFQLYCSTNRVQLSNSEPFLFLSFPPVLSGFVASVSQCCHVVQTSEHRSRSDASDSIQTELYLQDGAAHTAHTHQTDSTQHPFLGVFRTALLVLSVLFVPNWAVPSKIWTTT